MSPAEPAMHGDPSPPAPDARRTPEGERIVILNVDDYPPGRYATTRVLRQAGFQVVEAGTGGEALSLAAAEVPDLIVLDVNLPDVDGFEVCARLKEAPATAGIPILYLSALYHDTEHRVRGLNVGADAYLKQPVEPPELVATVNALLRARHVEAAVRDSEQRFRTLIEGTSQVLWTAAPDGSLAVPQPSWEAFTGQPADEHLGWGWLDAVHPEDRDRARRLWRALEAEPATLETELRLRRRDGAWRDVVSRGVPLPGPSGGVGEWIGTHTDVTERREAERERDQATREAQRARAEAEEANRAKSAFLANMSHEIRTPINAIIGYTELMEMGIAGPLTQMQEEHLGRVRTSSRHLLGLVNEVLDLAKIESGQLVVETATVRVADAVAAALALVEPLVGQAGLALENRVAEGCDLRYLGDPDRVRQILVNLLSNAVKFTAPGGRVDVSCGVAGQAETGAAGAQVSGRGPWACIRVEDTGRGIAPDQVEAVFSPFVQGESGHTRTVGGTGLGLTISRHLSRLMHGDLTLESRVGQGSTFTLWLPLAREPDSGPEPSHG